MQPTGEVTGVLQAVSRGDREAFGRLFKLLQGELHELAEAQMLRKRPDHTLQATALISLAWKKLVDQRRAVWVDRLHFLNVAAEAMRRVLRDHDRGRRCLKRGGGWVRRPLDDVAVPGQQSDVDHEALDGALRRLEADHPDRARAVVLHFYGGMTEAEISEVMAVSTRSVERYLRFAKAFLLDAYRELSDGVS